MLNFTFQNPTRIHFGDDQIKAISKEIPIGAKVLVTYGGGSIKSNGVYDQVVAALSEHDWVEFSGIEPNPTYDQLIKAVDVINEHNVDYILAVGGGSVVDGSKFIAAAAVFEGDDAWDILSKYAPITKALPLGAVLTLPATGSESNGGAVITRDGSKLSFGSPFVRPTFAILDPAVSLSLSDRQISNGVVDAFVHIMEQYMTYSINAKVQDRFSEGLLLTLTEEGPKALKPETKDDLEIRGNIMWSATMALNGLIGAGVPHDWATHMIGHELTAAHGVDHARSLSIVLPAVMKVLREDKRSKLLQYAERVWNISVANEDEKIDQAIAKTEAFFKAMEVPTRLSDADITFGDIDNLIAKLEKHGMVALGERKNITLEVSRQILETAL
ncbi:iron-containing alcohol dehydrogenase [Moritella viscosa]|uniref:Alcohol dehydrogenase, iron-containing n=1 Tax=Moritella viscosa TaxID=80854 RepID=A0ABY1HGY7_9GAMM|nr:iron-containing alcohol dehydrogenase [Moritella viscosa]CED60303.1 iron-containing alcohol dehydrogenase [Moritella viscosa]SGY98334.1 Alcohol dehydrogenase, iron-containing [Moritella viscosa]SGZ12313.1 Alcohol dehydrogenase, iron-containing [Moritella viscosa]SHO13919.1 Alcohol dehydrogenase, iron-containing [Moritella viscosa]SHO23455.1 Alcohol dehydrogenase, iron-containing [Moritella viscosa]